MLKTHFKPQRKIRKSLPLTALTVSCWICSFRDLNGSPNKKSPCIHIIFITVCHYHGLLFSLKYFIKPTVKKKLEYIQVKYKNVLYFAFSLFLNVCT